MPIVVYAVKLIGIIHVYQTAKYRVRTRRMARVSTRAATYSRRSSAPVASYGAHGGFRIRHMEYIGDVVAPDPAGDGKQTTPFASSVYGINPGDAGTFPWLSTLANSFEEYTWNRLAFSYKTTSSDAIVANGATASLGVVCMATEYNSNNPPFFMRQQMELYQGCMSVKPSMNGTHFVECRRNLTPYQTLYVRANVHFTNDQRGPLQNYDIGQFQVATCNCKPGVLGEIWAVYDITLKKPKLSLVNQPFMAAMDFGAPPTTTTPLLPSIVNGYFTLDLFRPGEFRTFPESGPTPLVCAVPRYINNVGALLILPTTSRIDDYMRFPDEAPVGTVITVMRAFTGNFAAAVTQQIAAGTVTTGVLWPPAVSECSGCSVLTQGHAPSTSAISAGAVNNWQYVQYWVFQRIFATIPSGSAAAGQTMPWGFHPIVQINYAPSPAMTRSSFRVNFGDFQEQGLLGTTSLPISGGIPY